MPAEQVLVNGFQDEHLLDAIHQYEIPLGRRRVYTSRPRRVKTVTMSVLILCCAYSAEGRGPCFLAGRRLQ